MGAQDWENYLAEFDFDLPEDRIAIRPTPRRGDSRLLLIDASTGEMQDRSFAQLPEILRPKDLLVFNNTRVSKRRVRLRRQSGAQLEALFLVAMEESSWGVLLRGAAKLKEGEELLVAGSDIRLRFGRGAPPDCGNSRLLAVDLAGQPAWKTPDDAEAFFEKHGELPIPPYLGRTAEAEDLDRYQTVFAKQTASAAAPTAGLHFTKELLDRLAQAGVEQAELELIVGYGTFAPLSTQNFEANSLHKERYSISPETCAKFAGCSGRRIAVGTTTLRVIESEWRSGCQLRPGPGSTTLFVRPPDRVQSVDALITNFHLPRSSLLLFVAAFLGPELTGRAYRHAVQAGYRFYSYGDAMLVLGRDPESS